MFDFGAMPVRQREGLAGLADVVPKFLDHAKSFRNGQFPKMFDFRMHSSTSKLSGRPVRTTEEDGTPSVGLEKNIAVSIDDAPSLVKRANGWTSDRNDQRHRAAPMTPTIFQDRIAAPVHALVLSGFPKLVDVVRDFVDLARFVIPPVYRMLQRVWMIRHWN